MSAAVYIHWISRYDYEPGWQLDPHDHPYYQIIHIVDGFGMFYLEESQIEIKPRLTFLIPPNERHGLKTRENTRIKTLDVKFDLNDAELDSHIKRLGGSLVIEVDEAKRRLENIRAESLSKTLYYKEVGGLELMRLLYSLVRTAESAKVGEAGPLSGEMEAEAETAGKREESVPERLKDYVRGNYAKPLGLDGISAALGYNKSYICHAFKKACGVTPMQFLYEYRISRAKELIRDTDYDLKHIAGITGFRSIHHFSRVFTDIAGMTPGSFRERERLGIRRDIFVDEDFHNASYVRKKDSTEEQR